MLRDRMRAIAAAVAGAVALSAVTFTPAEARVRPGDALALTAVAGAFGTIAALAARSYYEGGYYGGPAYYYEPVYGAPVYGGPIYAPSIYRGRAFAFRHGGPARHWHR
jgi:hypothetical protein